MSNYSVTQMDAFQGSAANQLPNWLGLVAAGRPHPVRRALCVAGICWLPLAILSTLRGDFIRPEPFDSFAMDLGAHARFLLAAPLLVLADCYCLPRLTALARQFISAGLVPEADATQYEAVRHSTRRLLNSTAAGVTICVLAYVVVIAAYFAIPAIDVPLWHGTRNGGFMGLSPAGIWGILISLPVLIALLIAWLWRVYLWTRFLWLMNRMELQLLPVHPDHTAGLGFLGSACETFLPLAAITGIISAGAVANHVVLRGASWLSFKPLMFGMEALVVALFAGPSLVFARRLREERERGQLAFGALALREGAPFRQLLVQGSSTETAGPDPAKFSATSGLFSIVSNLNALRLVPVDFKSVSLLVFATLVPFVPIALLSVPLDEILKQATHLLF